MQALSLSQLARIVDGELRNASGDARVASLSTDSRRVQPGAAFFALGGERTDGHRFVAEAVVNGAVVAIVASATDAPLPDEAPLLAVDSPLAALQRLAGWHRRECIGRVVAITGSNGKTIVKDALAGLVGDRSVAASPGSFNSQLGVPLAILDAEPGVDLGIFEAGLSRPGEMERHRAMLAPDCGVLTNIGLAHVASVGSRQALAREKMKLFAELPERGWLLLPAEEPLVEEDARALPCPVYRLGDADRLPVISSRRPAPGGLLLDLAFPDDRSFGLEIHTRSPELVEDLLIAASAAHLLGVDAAAIADGLDGYRPQPTRMEIWRSADGVTFVNDACSSDPTAVEAALRTTAANSTDGGRRIFVFGGMRELGELDRTEHAHVGTLAGEAGFGQICLVGDRDFEAFESGYLATAPEGEVVRVTDVSALGRHLSNSVRWGDTVLFKGPRGTGLGQAARNISGSLAQRCLWIDLGAIEENIARIRRHCGTGVRILAMAKALAYGTQLAQLAYWMSKVGIHDVGVSSATEGIQIRKQGIGQRIYVFLVDRDDVPSLVRHRLIPVIYSATLARHLVDQLAGAKTRLEAHLKVDTGMHRLGVAPDEAVSVARRLRDSGVVELTGVLTHFAGAEDPGEDETTLEQIRVFDEVVARLADAGFDHLTVHASNTAGTARFPQAHYDMVRVGLGLYGLYPSAAVEAALPLHLAVAATSRVSEINVYEPGERVGYLGTFRTRERTRLGVVPFGYADGLPRRTSNGGAVLVEGQPAPVVGAVSMDQLLIDLTRIPDADTGSEVLLFGSRGGHTLRPEETALSSGMIPHELLVGLGSRVERVFVEA